MKFQSSKTVRFTYALHEKNCEFFFYKCAKCLNVYFQVPISVLIPLKLKIKQCQLKKWLKRKNQSFWCIAVYIVTALTTQELKWNWRALKMVGSLVSKIFRIQSIKIGLQCIYHPGLRSFYKPCSKKFGFNFWAPILIQWYKNNMSGYDTG